MNAILDTTVVVHLLRRYKPALTWFNRSLVYAITAVTWMEIMEGTTSKAHQNYSESILSQFEIIYLTYSDQQWGMTALKQFQFTNHIGMNDSLIAPVAHRLNMPLYTHNLKHMTPLIGNLVVKPYS